MLEWFSEYWKYVIVFAVMCVAVVIMFYFAAKARIKYADRYKQQENEIKRLTALKNKYHPLTPEKLNSGDAEELLEAVSLVYQIKFEKSDYPEQEYKGLTDVQKNIYTLDVFVSDKTATEFFTLNDTMLRSRLYPALEMIGFDCSMDEFKVVSDMYDENNEDVSLDKTKLTQLDCNIEQYGILSKIKLSAAEYIKTHFELL